MILTTDMILENLKNYDNPKAKLSRMVKKGECYRVSKELYESDPSAPGYLLAGSIYGPSYISFEFALSYYGLIPEAVYTITSASFEKKKKKKYETPFGTFTYRDVPSQAFPFALTVMREGDYYYRMASPEKALCDELYSLPPVKNTDQLKELLFNNLRIEYENLAKLDAQAISSLRDKYRSTNVNKLSSFMGRIRQ